MRENISALMDGELDDHEARPVMERLRRDREMQALWSSYHLIGDALRRQAILTSDYAGRVMEKLEAEPTVIAPAAMKRSSSSPYHRLVMPIAASLAGLGVVAWVAISMNAAPEIPSQAAVVQPTELAANANGPVPVSLPLPNKAIHEYLIAHQGFSARSSIQGMAPYMRTVTEKRQAVR